MPSDEQGVIDAARARAAALVHAVAVELRRLMHPRMRWTTHLGTVLDRDAYIAANTAGSLVWREQRLEQPVVTVVSDTAVLVTVVVDDVVRDGRHETFRLRMTQAWVREAGTWRCMAGHAGPSL